MSPISASTSDGASAGRIDAIDLWRTLCIAGMIIYHTVFDLTLFGVLPESVLSAAPMNVLKYGVSGGFILCSGACARFSHDNLMRGFRIFLAGLAVSVVMAAVKMPVAFGILQLLGCSVLFYGALGDKAGRLETPMWCVSLAILFAVCAAVISHVTVESKLLYPLGLKYDGFYSADYYPLFPWLLLFLAGGYIGRLAAEHGNGRASGARLPRALTLPGRHSLLIYLAHQPIIYGLCALIFAGKTP